MDENLNQAIAKLFDRFPEHQHIADLEVNSCPCCTSSIPFSELSADRRAIAPESLGRYSYKALTTSGDVNHFKHFLPRLLETCDLVDDSIEGPHWENIVIKLDYAKWRTWPEPEVEAVVAVALAVLNQIKVEYDTMYKIDQLYRALSPEEWLRWLCRINAADFVEVCMYQGFGAYSYQEFPRFIDDMVAIDRRLGAGTVRERLENAFFNQGLAEANAQELSIVHHFLDRQGVFDRIQ